MKRTKPGRPAGPKHSMPSVVKFFEQEVAAARGKRKWQKPSDGELQERSTLAWDKRACRSRSDRYHSLQGPGDNIDVVAFRKPFRRD
jgi:hypothetical protein